MKRVEFDATWFLQDILVPVLTEFRDEPRSMRRALLACISMFHFLDYLEAEQEGGLLHFRAQMIPSVGAYLQGRYKQFEVLAAVANAAKHKYRSRGEKPFFFIGWTYERPPARAGVMQCGVSRVGDKIGGVEVEYDGDKYDIAFLLRECLRLLRQYFPQMLEEGVEMLPLRIE